MHTIPPTADPTDTARSQRLIAQLAGGLNAAFLGALLSIGDRNDL